MRKAHILACALYALSGLAAVPAHAQTTPPVSNTDPVRALPKSATAPGAPLTAPGPAAQAALPDPKAAFAAPKFILRAVYFDGARSAPRGGLDAAWAPYRGKLVSLADLRSIAARAEGIYARGGFPFIAIVVPPQDVKNGELHLRVVEGRISDLTIIGSNAAARRQATAALQPLLHKPPPLAIGDVEDAYERAREIPGLSISGALRRGSQPGGMQLLVDARKTDFRTYANVNNFYAPALGRWGVLVGGDYDGASRYGDLTSVQLFTTTGGEQQTYRISHLRRINTAGTSLSAAFLYSSASPQGAFTPLDLATGAVDARFEAAQPLIRRTAVSLTGYAAFEVEDQETRVFSSVRLTEDDLRLAILGLRGAAHGRLGDLTGTVEVRHGLGGLGGSSRGDADLSRPDVDPEATVVRVSAQAQTRRFGPVAFVARLEAQYADRSLAAAEEFAFGNLTLGRGYEPGAALGDRAVGGSLEARFGPYPLPKPWFGGLRAQPFVYGDVARLWNVDPYGVADRTVASVGGGVSLELPNRLHLDLSYANPLRAPMGLGERRPAQVVLVNLTVGLDPVFSAIGRHLPFRSGRT